MTRTRNTGRQAATARPLPPPGPGAVPANRPRPGQPSRASGAGTRSTWLTSFLVILTGVAVAAGVALVWQDSLARTEVQRFARSAGHISDELQTRLERLVALAQAASTPSAEGPDTGDDTWASDTAIRGLQLGSAYPGAIGIATLAPVGDGTVTVTQTMSDAVGALPFSTLLQSAFETATTSGLPVVSDTLPADALTGLQPVADGSTIAVVAPAFAAPGADGSGGALSGWGVVLVSMPRLVADMDDYVGDAAEVRIAFADATGPIIAPLAVTRSLAAGSRTANGPTIVATVDVQARAFRIDVQRVEGAQLSLTGPLAVLAGGSLLAVLLGVLSNLVLRGRSVARLAAVRAMRDLETSQLELRRNEERFRALVAHSTDLVCIIDPSAAILYASPSSVQVLGYPDDTLTGRSLADVVLPQDRALLYSALEDALEVDERSVGFDLLVRRNDGLVRQLEIVLTNLRSKPAVAGVVLNARDVTEARSDEVQLKHRASHDQLTGLPNRRMLEEIATTTMLRSRQRDCGVAVLFIDLDGFKAANDTYGHAVGDELLKIVATRLKRAVRADDVVLRLGGDEFVVIGESDNVDEWTLLASRIGEVLRAPYSISGYEVRVSSSIGISVRSARTAEVHELLHAADAAMYQAKNGGKDRWVLSA